MTEALSLRGVGVDFDTHTALDHIDLTVAEGERVALAGPSGAGKTTMLRVCNGSLPPSRGTAEILGMAALDEEGRRAIGTIYQRLDLVGPLQVIHNVNAGRLGTWTRRRALRSLIRPVEVDSGRAALDRVGVGHLLRQRTDRCSGGEQQRIALARVLVQDPRLIIADEPVSSLDPARSEEVIALLCGIAAQDRRALVVSLHDFDLARRHCDRVVGVRAGRVLFDLPASEVSDRQRDALYEIGSALR